jgi:hypothetical protein
VLSEILVAEISSFLLIDVINVYQFRCIYILLNLTFHSHCYKLWYTGWFTVTVARALVHRLSCEFSAARGRKKVSQPI